MSTTFRITCKIQPTDAQAPLGMEIWLDDQKILDQDWIQTPIDFSHDAMEIDSDHKLRFVLKNKTAEHTKIDEQGNIIHDACLQIDQLCFDDIELGYLFFDQSVYQHDFNGTQDTVEQKFYGTMGCNGTVTLKFSSPIYLWLLEHM